MFLALFDEVNFNKLSLDLTVQMATLLMMMTLCALTAQTAALDIILADAGNVCPANYEKITLGQQCKQAVTKLGAVWNGREKTGLWPSGCYYCNGVEGCSDGTWFNRHNTGSANGGTQPWCYNPNAATPPPEPTPAQTYGGVLFAGDSDVANWGTSDAFPGLSKTSVHGATCRKVGNRLADKLEKHNLTEVVLVCGENDIMNGANEWNVFDHWKIAEERINNHGTRVICMGLKPEPGTKGTHKTYRAFDDLIFHEMRGPAGTGRGGVSMAGGREGQRARKGNGVKRLRQIGAEMV